MDFSKNENIYIYKHSIQFIFMFEFVELNTKLGKEAEARAAMRVLS